MDGWGIFKGGGLIEVVTGGGEEAYLHFFNFFLLESGTHI